MSRLLLLSAGAMCATWIAAVPAAAQTAVATAPGRFVVTAQDLREELFFVGWNKEGAANPRTAEGLELALHRMITRKLSAAEARRTEVDRVPLVASAVSRASEVILADELAKRAVASMGTSEQEVRRYFDINRAQFRGQPRRKVRHIVVATLEQAQSLRKAILSGASFEAIAHDVNIDDTRPTSGQLGWVRQGLMVKPFDDAAFTLSVGQVSDVLQTSLGFHLVIVEEIDLGSVPPFELIKEQVLVAMRNEAVAKLEQQLWENAKPLVDRNALLELLK